MPVELDQNPKITDDVRFLLQTPDADGCFLTFPYKIDNITIYYVERNFSSGNQNEYADKTYDPKKLVLAESAEVNACLNPTSENISIAKKLRLDAEQTVTNNSFYFDQANPVKIVGIPTNPAWLTGKQITGISTTNPSIITSPSHGLNTGDKILIYGSNSVPAIDDEYVITYISANTFSIPFNLNDISYTAGTSGVWFTQQQNVDNILTPIVIDNKTTIGTFEYIWSPLGCREGDYFICWTWTPLIGGTSLSSHIRFSLAGNTQVTTSIPTHFTNPEKYKTLLEKYTPEMFKTMISDKDLTPIVLNNFNQAVAMGFTTLENLANQIVDLQDANSLHEALLPYLANLFNLKLKTADPTKWRGQIKRAIPLFKTKGTRKSLEESFFQAGMRLVSYKQLWQVISKYTWQESFVYENLSFDFILEKTLITPLDNDNFELYIRPVNSNFYTTLTSDYVTFSTVDGVTTMTWVGDTLLIDPIVLVAGDIIRVLYQYQTIPSPTEQSLEDYVRLLPLIDNRDEVNQTYPLKNWNVRGIEPDDVLFNLIIPSRHPYHDFIVYGKVRTEFPYSENIYNMEEYNGSIRNSKAPCDIDKNFVDTCFSCISSSYNIDVEIENISDDRIREFHEVIREFIPFHAVLNTVRFYGGLQEFITSPIENIEVLIKHSINQYCISGEGQVYLNRTMKGSNLNNLSNSNCVFRDELADKTQIVNSVSGTAYNSDIVVYCPSAKLTNRGMRNDGSAIMEILSGSYIGSYLIDRVEDNIVHFTTSPTEPIDECNNLFAYDGTQSTCSFAFRIINPVIDNFNYGSLCEIYQDDYVVFTDSDKDFADLGVESQFDVNQGTSVSAWEIQIPAYSMTNYTILNIDPNGKLILSYDGTMPTSSVSGLTYTIYNGLTAVATGTIGVLTVTNRGRTIVSNPDLLPISSMIRGSNFYQKISSVDYQITSLVTGTDDQFYISGYIGGTIVGTNLLVNQRLIEDVVGYMTHRGLNVEISGVDYETNFGIQNGANTILPYTDPIINNFKENYIVQVNGEDYWIADIDGNDPIGSTTIKLYGRDSYWTTYSNGGTPATVSIYKYESKGATIKGPYPNQPEHTFENINRNGSPFVTGTEESSDTVVTSLSNKNDSMLNELIKHNEVISYRIEYSNGSKEEGKI